MYAAGTEQGPPNASVLVTCSNKSFTAPVAKNGDYGVRGIPSGASCTLRVKLGDLTSDPISFNADKTVVRFHGVVRKLGGKVVVLRR